MNVANHAAAAFASNPPPGFRQALQDEAVGRARRLLARAFARASARFFRHLSHLQPTAPEVDVSRRQVVQALVVSTVVVVPDELLDALFELSWQVVVVQQESDDIARSCPASSGGKAGRGYV